MRDLLLPFLPSGNKCIPWLGSAVSPMPSPWAPPDIVPEVEKIDILRPVKSTHSFLDASSHLYKRVCRSVRLLVRPAVGYAFSKTAKDEIKDYAIPQKQS